MRNLITSIAFIVLLSSLISCKKDSEDIKQAEKNVAINELQASNSTTATDDDDQYDDWIELFNLTAAAVDLSGYYLTDKSDNITKWEFPAGTTIPANGYLIVWADGDLTQTGVHADFKLSASGEELYLYNPDQLLVDGVVFGEQTGETSYARIPNGTGDFQWGTPTFGTSNN